MLILASQRIETLFFDEDPTYVPTKRGSTPSLVEWIILSWVSGEYDNYFNKFSLLESAKTIELKEKVKRECFNPANIWHIPSV